MIDPDQATEPTASSEPPGRPRRVRRRVLVGLAALLPLGGLATLLGFATFKGTSRLGAVGVDGTQVASDFTLPSFAGGQIRLADYRGKPVFLYFWASWCVPCREEAPMLEALWREYQARGLVFLGVNIQDSEDDARAFLREFNITFPNVRDVDGKVYIDYGVYGVPESFFVRRDGTIAARWIGKLEEEGLRSSLDELLAP